MRISEAFQQLSYLAADLSAIVNDHYYRWLTMWFAYGSAPGLIRYRLSRCMFLLIGETFTYVRVVMWPLFFILRIIGPQLDISYRADIGPGLRVLHPRFAVLVSKKAVCGRGLILTGGNWIVMKKRLGPGNLVIGDDVILYANAIVLGPVRVDDRCVIGAGAVVMTDCPSGSTMVGAPAVRLVGTDLDAATVGPREALSAVSSSLEP